MTGHRAGRSPWWAAGFVFCAGVALLAYVLLPRPDTADLPARKVAPRAPAHADAAADLLEQLTAAVRGDDRAAVTALAAPDDRAAVRELAALDANVDELGITDLSLRYVDENAGRSDAAGPDGRGWVGDVQVDWRLAHFDAGASHLETTMSFVQTDAGARFVSARGDFGDAAPLWLLERLAVRESRRSLVMAAARGHADQFAGLADQAVRDVRKVLPRWRGKLVVEVPRTQADLSRVLGSEDGAYDAIAAVTTPVDGSMSADAPVHIFVNPSVFNPLGERGAQIVMSHEAAHVALHAATSTMPTWLLEGFADYVALAHVDLPVEVTASQILEQVRSDGPPAGLPSPGDFESENPSLGASYEAAWLACRLLASTYGEPALIDFYRRADRDGDTQGAFGSLGTTQAAFTTRWRDELSALADQ